jgi:hypothetical protein
VAYDTALEHAVTGGFGYFGINTRYATDDGFDQDIVIEAKPNCFASTATRTPPRRIPRTGTSPSSSPSLTKKAFEAAGKAPMRSASRARRRQTVRGDGENVRIAACGAREKSVRQIVRCPRPSHGRAGRAVRQAIPLLGERLVVDLKVYEANKALFDALGVSVLGQPRDVPSFKVTQRSAPAPTCWRPTTGRASTSRSSRSTART